MDPEIELSQDELDLLAAAAAAGPICDARFGQMCLNLAGRRLLRPAHRARRLPPQRGPRAYFLTEQGWAKLKQSRLHH